MFPSVSREDFSSQIFIDPFDNDYLDEFDRLSILITYNSKNSTPMALVTASRPSDGPHRTLDDQVTSLEEKMDYLFTDDDRPTAWTTLPGLSRHMTTFEEQMNTRFTNTDKSLAMISTAAGNRLKTMENCFKAVDNRFTAMDGRLVAVEGRLVAMDGRLIALRTASKISQRPYKT